ncbi:MAG: hypothetical protein ABUS48_05905 [Pseudomonadota bacterium]
MSEAEHANQLIAAFVRVANGARLASIAIEYVAAGDVARVETSVSRETRTLLFLSAEAFDAAGARLATADAIFAKESP